MRKIFLIISFIILISCNNNNTTININDPVIIISGEMLDTTNKYVVKCGDSEFILYSDSLYSSNSILNFEDVKTSLKRK